ncbi:hypothetical protein PLICRDRAFT_120958 [Plicaturopsis crispa FD-325 SS-3]|nr:hypothetical protein PLICRDRAFT_120958 [Plicaturopsis crispa FD-325 SS-3]
MAATETDFMDAPPPPYEAAQIEFEQKTTQAVQLSQSQSSTDRHRDDQDEWETWDEAAFEAAAAAASSGPNRARSPAPAQPSQSREVAPLRVVKKQARRRAPQKERPSWLAEAHLDHSSSSSPTASGSQAPGLSPRQHGQSSSSGPVYLVQNNIPDPDDEDEDRSLPPPPFTEQGPNLDGPPFEQVVLAYNGSTSMPPSPLSSPQQRNTPLPISRRASPAPQQPVLSVEHPVQRRIGPRASASSKYARNSVAGRIGFNPLQAYSRNAYDRGQPDADEPIIYNASAFYNSAVSAHLSSEPMPSPARQIHHSPSAQPVKHAQSASNIRPRYQSHSYSASQESFHSAPPQMRAHSFQVQHLSPRALPPPRSLSPAQRYPQQQPYSPQPVTPGRQNRWAVSEHELNQNLYQ